MAREPGQMPGADYRQDLALVCADFFTQTCGHVLIALGDHRFVQLRAFAGEIAEACLQHVALLELFDFLFAHLVGSEQAAEQPAGQFHLAEKSQAPGCAFEGQADLAIDQMHRQALRARQVHRLLQFRARFDAQLLGQATLIRRQGQIRREQRHAPLADHLYQIQAGEGIGIAERLQALRIQFHRHCVVTPAADRPLHGGDAGQRHVRGAEQGIAHAVAFDDAMRLAGQRIVQNVGGLLSHGSFHQEEGRCRRSRARVASARRPASGRVCGRFR